MQTIIRFFKTIFLIDLAKGLWLTLKYTPKPAFTFQYPWSGARPRRASAACCGCRPSPAPAPRPASSATSARRPARTISSRSAAIANRAPKIKVLDYFDFNLSRCSFCGLCAEVCPTKPIKALIMSEDYELGTYSRESQILRVDQMYDGVAIEHYTR